MKAAVALLRGIWDLFMNMPMFDLPFTFGHFLVALCFLDVAFIIIRHSLQNTGDGERSSNNSNKSEE